MGSRLWECNIFDERNGKKDWSVHTEDLADLSPSIIVYQWRVNHHVRPLCIKMAIISRWSIRKLFMLASLESRRYPRLLYLAGNKTWHSWWQGGHVNLITGLSTNYLLDLTSICKDDFFWGHYLLFIKEKI